MWFSRYGMLVDLPCSGIHYHQFLKAGENTLNVKICRLLVESLNEIGAYDSDDFLERYISFMMTPGNHRDTYLEECHRNFFANYAKGIPPHQCGTNEKHIGGIFGIIPILAFYHNLPGDARNAAMNHLSLTHPGSNPTILAYIHKRQQCFCPKGVTQSKMMKNMELFTY